MRSLNLLGSCHCVKSVRIKSFSGLNARKYRPEKLRIRTLFKQCVSVKAEAPLSSVSSQCFYLFQRWEF